jgi:hypothetical protein
MAPGKKTVGRKGGRAPSGSPPQDTGRSRTYRVVIIKDGVFVAGRQRRRKGLAS